MILKKLLLLFIILMCFSCSNIDFPEQKRYEDVTSTIYQPGHLYTRRFYFLSYLLGGTNSLGPILIYILESECGRKWFALNEIIHSEDIPSRELMESVNERNNLLDTNEDIKYRLVADFKFIADTYGLASFWRVSEWKIVLSELKPYLSPEDNETSVNYLFVY